MYQLPKALPDELLLSRLIRFITISGISSSEFLQTCFGSKRISLHPFLTSGLSSIAKVCHESTNLLLNEQTLTPLFCFFLPVHARNLQKMIVTINGARAFRSSQLVSFESGHSLGLKSCPLCVEHDLLKYGISYWHVSHQVPGVDTCGYHGARLSFLKLTQRQRLIKWLLPQPEIDIRYSPLIEYEVAKFSTKLLSLLAARQHMNQITEVYRHYLKENGYLTPNGRVRRKAVMQEFFKYIENHSQTNPAMVPRTQQDYRYVSQLLEAGGSHHPYRHLLFGTWLLGDASQAFSNLPKADFSDKKNTPEPVNNISNKCLNLLKAGSSLAHTSRVTGKSRCYLKRIALLNGISLNLKPKTLTQQVTNAICSLAYSGFHRREIARRCGVGIGSVEQTISSHSGLVERRKQCHFQSARRKNRFVILKYLGSHPVSIRNDVKQQCNSAFYWLYLNDRAWLEEKLPIACKPKGRY
ncbi:TnsD family Tn7-like transposition protein [Alteromonas australica]|uniref:TnsD family Tn7-like transposition protein n=1 Tax=Alteromonas TaxID=226 RepID=UPI000C42FDDC|nr:hypothetical protein [Alteromonas sp.]QPL50217.1 TniQ family protein [Alteromonas sp. B31-7]|tara:strand:+ start:730 stop:2133 length:1404 start_codon:yes stop_codon:yes gene_type:complete